MGKAPQEGTTEIEGTEDLEPQLPTYTIEEPTHWRLPPLEE